MILFAQVNELKKSKEVDVDSLLNELVFSVNKMDFSLYLQALKALVSNHVEKPEGYVELFTGSYYLELQKAFFDLFGQFFSKQEIKVSINLKEIYRGNSSSILQKRVNHLENLFEIQFYYKGVKLGFMDVTQHFYGFGHAFDADEMHGQEGLNRLKGIFNDLNVKMIA